MPPMSTAAILMHPFDECTIKLSDVQANYAKVISSGRRQSTRVQYVCAPRCAPPRLARRPAGSSSSVRWRSVGRSSPRAAKGGGRMSDDRGGGGGVVLAALHAEVFQALATVRERHGSVTAQHRIAMGQRRPRAVRTKARHASSQTNTRRPAGARESVSEHKPPLTPRRGSRLIHGQLQGAQCSALSRAIGQLTARPALTVEASTCRRQTRRDLPVNRPTP